VRVKAVLIVLGHNRDTPLYEQIVEEIKAKILSGELEPGAPLPSIRQLASDLLISVITTKRAYQELESQGFIQTQQGRGTYVKELDKGAASQRRSEEIESRLREVASLARRMGVPFAELKSICLRVLQTEQEDW